MMAPTQIHQQVSQPDLAAMKINQPLDVNQVLDPAMGMQPLVQQGQVPIIEQPLSFVPQRPSQHSSNSGLLGKRNASDKPGPLLEDDPKGFDPFLTQRRIRKQEEKGMHSGSAYVNQGQYYYPVKG